MKKRTQNIKTNAIKQTNMTKDLDKKLIEDNGSLVKINELYAMFSSKEINHGGFCKVYTGININTKQEFAIKIVIFIINKGKNTK